MTCRLNNVNIKNTLDKASAVNNDIIIPLAKTIDINCGVKNLNYNVSDFLRLHRQPLDNVDEFVDLLDANIHIDPNDQRYSHIYQGIDVIVKRVVSELSKSNPSFVNAKLRQTGSSTSGVKVGLPHESDYVLNTPTACLSDRRSFFTQVKRVVTSKALELTVGLNGYWIIHGVEHHWRTGGVCLVMQSCVSPNNPFSDEVGVSVDIVPTTFAETQFESLNEKAETFLQKSLDEFDAQGLLYSVFAYPGPGCKKRLDTGFIENDLMRELSSDTIKAYRVTKFLLQTMCKSSSTPIGTIGTLNEERLRRLYGYKPLVSSYAIRILFIQLLIHVHGTEAEKRLKGGLLVICLLDMLKQCVAKCSYNIMFLNHPFLKQRHFILQGQNLDDLDDIIHFLGKRNLADTVNEFSLLNNDEIYDSYISSIPERYLEQGELRALFKSNDDADDEIGDDYEHDHEYLIFFFEYLYFLIESRLRGHWK